MLHKTKFIISSLIAPGPKIKPKYNHRDFKGKIGSHWRLQLCQARRSWAAARGGGPAPRPPRPRAPGTRPLPPQLPAPLPRGRGRPWLLCISPRPQAASLRPQPPRLLPNSSTGASVSSKYLSSRFPPGLFFFLTQDKAGSPATLRSGGCLPSRSFPVRNPPVQPSLLAPRPLFLSRDPPHHPSPAPAAHPRTPRC